MRGNVDFILTTFSATMFGDAASVYLKTIDEATAKALLGPETQIVATRPSHENLAKQRFGNLPTTRFADLSPDKSAVLIHYRGPPIDDSGNIPENSTLTFYLIESEAYDDGEDDVATP